MPRAKAGVAAKKVKTEVYKLAEKFEEGEILTDLIKKEWKLGKVIGCGGFGLLYLASPVDGPGGESSQYVLKVEPHSNGPLFCELAFYQRVAKPATISSWMEKHKLKYLGVPKYIASGSHQRSGHRYRFMVMERYGSDLQKLFEANGKRFSRKSVLQMAVRLLDALEYIHENEYVHADIKASNLLLGHAKGTTDQVFLVDYGLAYRYTANKKHKEYKEDPKRAHDGTIEFTSRDAHKGVFPSRRGDLEILGYCLLQWLCQELPWESNLNNKDWVRDQKIKYMNNIPSLMKACFGKNDIPGEIQKYMEHVVQLKYEEKPDYNGLRKIFQDAMKKMDFVDNGKLDLTLTASSPKKAAASKRNIKAVKQKAEPRKARKRPSLSPIGSVSDDLQNSPPPCKVRAVAKSPKGRVKAARSTPASSPALARARATKNVVGSPAKSNGVVSRKAKLRSTNASTQTSPGLKGLKRSRRQ